MRNSIIQTIRALTTDKKDQRLIKNLVKAVEAHLKQKLVKGIRGGGYAYYPNKDLTWWCSSDNIGDYNIKANTAEIMFAYAGLFNEIDYYIYDLDEPIIDAPWLIKKIRDQAELEGDQLRGD